MKRILFLLLVLCIVAVPLTVQAQSTTITISQNEIAPDFPDRMVFRLSAESDAEIERIALRYGTNGRSCQTGGSLQTVSFEAGNSVDTEWEWELRRSGALPPGTAIWWQWEIEDAAGNTMVSDRQEYKIVDDSHRWQSLSEDDVTVSWYLGDDTFGQAMLEQSQQSLAYLQSELGLPAPETVDLWLYDSGASVQEAIVNMPEWTGGVAFPEFGITVLGVAPGQEAWAAEIIPHELTHLLEGILTFNCRGIHLPTWLSEGLARHAEGEANAADTALVQTALTAGTLPPLKSLASGFSAYSDGAGLAYAQSGQVVAYLVSLQGAEKMTALLQAMQQGQNVDNALLAVYGFDTVGLDAQWRTSLGYVPTPTSAADVAALAATATAVPTIALGGIPQSKTAVPESLVTPQSTNTPQPTKTTTPTVESATLTPTPTPTQPPAQPSPSISQNTPPADPPSFPWMWLMGGLVVAIVIVVVLLKWKK